MGAGAATRTKGRVADALILSGGALLAVLVVASAIQTVSVRPEPRNPSMASLSRRLQADPLDLAALRDLALAWDRQGERDRAEAALSFVGRRTWRDPPTLGWLLRSRIQEGRFVPTMEIADAVLRQDGAGTIRPLLFPALIAAAGDDAARGALDERLRRSPPWRSDFLRVLGATGDPAQVSAVFAALSRGPAPPTPAEYAPYVDRLVEAKAYAAAAGAWRAVAREPVGAPWPEDATDFAQGADGTPFTWRQAEGVGVGSDIVPAPGDAGHVALRVDYDGYASPVLPARLLVLAPGHYRIGWRERGDGAGEARLFWRVRCADTGEVLAREPPGGAAGAGEVWSAEAMDVRIPADGCAGQWLELAAAPGERRSPTTSWYESPLVTAAP